MSGVHSPTNHDLATSNCGTVKSDHKWKVLTKGRSLRTFRVKLVPNGMAVCFNHADSFSLDHFDQNLHLIFWLKLNNDTVFEASILEYDRREPPLGARSCHRYLEFWQDLKISIYYVNHVLLEILIVQIRGWGRTLHLTKDMNNHMVDPHFQVKGESWHFAKKRNTYRYVL